MAITKFDGPHKFLSNFYQIDIIYEGKTYHSVEHAYQAAKTTISAERAHICLATTAAEAKKRGKKVTLRPNWDSMKIDVMRDLLDLKFEDAELGLKLLETGDQELIEGNWWGDTYWGVCRGIGENHLGKLLMERREALRGSYAE